MAYCTYTAATVVVQDMKDGRPGTKGRFETFMRALNAIRASCPGIQRSIDILTRGLESNERAKTARPSVVLQNESVGDEAQYQVPQIPAFPYHDFSYAFADGTDSTGMNPFFDLDSFPHLWFDDFSENILLNE
jgi:hypothetical protein